MSDAEEVTEAYQVETPSSLTMEEPPTFPSSNNHAPHPMEGVSSSSQATPSLGYDKRLAITGPNFQLVTRNQDTSLVQSQGVASGEHPSGGIQVSTNNLLYTIIIRFLILY